MVRVGWGSPAIPDPTLLVPRGFDPAAKRFKYDVSARFADTRPGHTLFRVVLPAWDATVVESTRTTAESRPSGARERP